MVSGDLVPQVSDRGQSEASVPSSSSSAAGASFFFQLDAGASVTRIKWWPFSTVEEFINITSS